MKIMVIVLLLLLSACNAPDPIEQGIAEPSNHSSKCQGASDLSRNSCYATLANTQNDVQICMQIDSYLDRHECVTNIAIKQEDASICSTLDKALGSACVSSVAQWLRDETLCEDISSPSRESCFAEIAVLKSDETLCQRLNNESKLRECLFRVGKSGKVQFCNNSNSEYEIDQCILSGSLRANSSKHCVDINDPDTRYNCIIQTDSSRLNEDLCQDLEYERENCYIEVALHNRDISSCEHRQSPRPCVSAVTSLTLDTETCAGQTVQLADLCYETLAIRLHDIELCRKMMNMSARDECLARLAFYHRDPALCRSLQEESVGRCMSSILTAKLTFNEPFTDDLLDACDKVTESHVIYCTQELAILSQNTAMCKELEEFAQTNCLFVIAVRSSDSSLCKQVPGPFNLYCRSIINRDPSACEGAEYRNNCYIQYAKFTGDIGVCDNIDDDSRKDTCIGNSVLNNPTIEKCKLLEDELKDSCIIRMVHMNNDMSLCNEILDEESKRLCFLDKSIKS